MGSVYYAKHEYANAADEYAEASKYWKKLAIEFSQNAQYREQELHSNSQFGLAKQELGDWLAAKTAFLEAVMYLEEQVSNHPNAFASRLGLGYAHRNLGGVYDKQGDLDKTATHYRKAVQVFNQLHQDRPEDFNSQEGLGASYAGLGRVANALHHFREAVEWFTKAASTLEPLREKDPGHHNVKAYLVEVYWGLTQIYSAAAHKNPDESLPDERQEGYAAQAVVWLSKAVRVGFCPEPKQLENWLHTDLAPLSGREDFQLVLAELRKRDAANGKSK